MWTYKQSTGVFSKDELSFVGYSGHDAGINSPEYEKLRDIGPIPAGLWIIGPAFRHQTKGPVCMALAPKGHDAHLRDGFLIHGDNKDSNRSASHGCIILPRSAREDIAQSTDRQLLVIS